MIIKLIYKGVLPPIEKIVEDTEHRLIREAKKYISRYPPETIANSPANPAGYWYERGYGTWKRNVNGVVGFPTSEKLFDNWTINRNILSNSVSYAEFVHGKKQIELHRRRNWRNLKDLEREIPSLLSEIIQDIINVYNLK